MESINILIMEVEQLNYILFVNTNKNSFLLPLFLSTVNTTKSITVCFCWMTHDPDLRCVSRVGVLVRQWVKTTGNAG